MLGAGQWNSPGSVLSQLSPLRDSPVVMICELPPVANPVASDIVNKSLWPAAKGNVIEYDPVPSLKADEGMEMLRGVPKAWSIRQRQVKMKGITSLNTQG